MFNITEMRILKRLFDDLTSTWTIHKLSVELKLPYPQIHRNTQLLIKRGLVIRENIGKSSNISIPLKNYNDDFINVEIERKKEAIVKYKTLKLLDDDLKKLNQVQFICLIFGSYAEKTTNPESDIDLLFIIPDEYSFKTFEKNARTYINIPKVDIHITTEKGLIDMWSNPEKINLGNEILKKHVIFRGAEAFLHLRERYYVG